MKQILIPVDFSDQSWKAALCAISMYQNTGVCFYLFYSETPKAYDTDITVKSQQKIKELQSWLVLLKKMIKKGQEIIPLSRQGGFVEDIRWAIEKNDIELIVLSTHYPNIFCDGVKGSYTREIITRVKCPVLIVPRETSCIMPKQVVLLSDFNSIHRSQATTVISNFMERTQAHLNILQLSKSDNALTVTQNANKSFLQTSLDQVSHSFHFVIDKTMDEALQSFVDMHQVDLVILFAKNINLSENLLFSPTLNQKKDYHKKLPFLIVHE
tara:strand:- start:4066 stop:4872 length:807 start_codon:yes stop_codon:yes gene_type:complete